jgi:hypothetical protein
MDAALFARKTLLANLCRRLPKPNTTSSVTAPGQLMATASLRAVSPEQAEITRLLAMLSHSTLAVWH